MIDAYNDSILIGLFKEINDILMVVGKFGVIGRIVTSLVVMAISKEFAIVPIPRLRMGDITALGLKAKRHHVTWQNVQSTAAGTFGLLGPTVTSHAVMATSKGHATVLIPHLLMGETIALGEKPKRHHVKCQNVQVTITVVSNAWSSWFETSCSVTCGNGTKTRVRHCSTGHSEDCPGNSTGVIDCFEQHCPVNGKWATWVNWSSCDVTCGHGSRERTRTCSNPQPLYGGLNCTGDEHEIESCTMKICPAWTSWFNGACSVTCGNGTMTRMRHCNTGHREDCPGHFQMTVDCYKPHCPVAGNWSEWVTWSTCSATCNGGLEHRNRSCSNPAPQYGGQDCVGNGTESKTCFLAPCPVAGNWGEWVTWSTCSATCNGGLEHRNRSCSNPAPQFGGHDCVGNGTESKTCFLAPCPVAGNWGEWVTWSTCSATCNGGMEHRNRSCSNPAPQFGGHDCVGNGTESKTCFLAPCPVAGNWGEWVTWSTCSATCNGGMEHRNRSCSNPAPQFGGHDCVGNGTESKTCFLAPCPVAGNWGEWVTWSTCSATCNGGLEHRHRSCSNPSPQYGGQDCDGNGTESKTCFLTHCPVAGNWSEWVTWSTCSASCNGGLEHRNRSCSNPAPQYGGQDCDGNGTESKTCFLTHCAVDGQWSEWNKWSACDVTCEGGHKHRTRSCTQPPPSYDGQNCTDEDNQTSTSWSDWFKSGCDVTCGTGTESFLRMKLWLALLTRCVTGEPLTRAMPPTAGHSNMELTTQTIQ
ncbi:HMCN1-like protein, partial [Mya arenaria]